MMLSACELCLSVFPNDMTTCPLCQQATDWLCQTYDLDGPPRAVAGPASTVAAMK